MVDNPKKPKTIKEIAKDTNYKILINKLKEDSKLLIGVFILGLFIFVFFACMLSFISHAEACFVSP